MNAIAKLFKELEPHEVFDTVASLRRHPREGGARFDVRQPIPVIRAERLRPNRTLPFAKAQIFVVDHHPGLADFARTILDHAGFRTCAFQDHTIAGHAFAFAASFPELLIVRDSETDPAGAGLVHACRAMNPQLKVILLCDPATKPTPSGSAGLADVVLQPPFCGTVLVQAAQRFCTPMSPDGAPSACS